MADYARKLADKLKLKVWVDRNEAAKILRCNERTFRRHLNKNGGGLVIFWVRTKKHQMKKAFTTMEWIEWAAEKGLPKYPKNKKYEKVKARLAEEMLKIPTDFNSDLVKDPLNVFLSVFLLGVYIKGDLKQYLMKKADVFDLEADDGWTYIQNLIDDFRYMLTRSPELWEKGIIRTSKGVGGSIKTLKKK